MTIRHASLPTALVVARLLDRLDASRGPVDAHQYRTVAERLSILLQEPGVDWRPLLDQSPAATVVYENLRYADAGLCRAPLGQSTAAELAARQLITAARRPPAA